MSVEAELGKEFLDHHGVRGMKWGVRGARMALNARKSRNKPPVSEDAQRHAVAKKKKLSELSDKEIKELVTRMNMEQQVRRMNPATLSKGHTAAKNVIAVAGTVTAITAIAQGPIGKKIAKAIKSIATEKGRKAITSIDVSSIGRTEKLLG